MQPTFNSAIRGNWPAAMPPGSQIMMGNTPGRPAAIPLQPGTPAITPFFQDQRVPQQISGQAAQWLQQPGGIATATPGFGAPVPATGLANTDVTNAQLSGQQHPPKHNAFNPLKWAGVLTLPIVAGYAINRGVETMLHSLEHNPNSRLLGGLRLLDNLWGVNALNGYLEDKLNARPAASNASELLQRAWNRDNGKTVYGRFTNAWIGTHGILIPYFQRAGLNPADISKFQAADTEEKLARLLNSDTANLYPEELQKSARRLTRGGIIRRTVRKVMPRTWHNTLSNFWHTRIRRNQTTIAGLVNAYNKEIGDYNTRNPGTPKPLLNLSTVLRDINQNLTTSALERPFSTVSGDTSVRTLQTHFNNYHLVGKLRTAKRFSPQRALYRQLRVFGKRARHMGEQIPVLDREARLMRALSAPNKLRPIGRWLTKTLTYLQQGISGATLRESGFKMVSKKPGWGGLILTSLLIFGPTVYSFFSAPKESKVSSLLDGIAAGLGGLLGFEFLRHLVNSTGFPTSLPFGHNLMRRQLYRPLSGTVGGLLTRLTFPLIIAGSFGIGWICQKMVHLAVGDPKEIEKRLMFEADRQRALNTPQHLFDQFKDGQVPAIPGVIPNVDAFVPNKQALTVENTGLSPERIQRNLAAEQQESFVRQGMEELKPGTFFWRHVGAA